MTAIITSKFRILNAEKFKEHFDGASNSKNMYLFIGRPQPWAVDTAPPAPNDSVDDEVTRRYDLISLKRIVDSTVSNVIPRVNWDTSGNTKYVAYDNQDTALFSHPTNTETEAAELDGTYEAGSFYVLTDDNNVYKCLFNNGNVKSTDKPTGRSTSVIETSDGYKWKYLYTISASETLKFMTDDWMPVKYISSDDGSNQWDVQSAAVDGSIEIIKVTNVGSGYTNTFSGTLVSGSVGGFVLPSGASAVDDAYNNATAYITAGTGAGQSSVISDYVGSSRAATVATSFSPAPDGTSTIEILPTVTITGDGASCAAKAVVASNTVTGINVTAAGTGYRTATVVISGCGGTGATARAIISPIGGHGAHPVKELGGYYVMVNVRLTYNEDDFPLDNDYRRFGIISNVRNYNAVPASATIATSTNLSGCKALTVGSVSGSFDLDELLTSNGTGTPTAKIIEVLDAGGGSKTIKYFQDETTGFTPFAPSQVITGTDSGASAIITALVNPEILPFSGDIIYVENRRPIQRAESQLESIQIVVEH